MHDCNQCGGDCFCHGDIDDCPVETIEYAYMHCTGCGCSEDEDCDGIHGFIDDDDDDDYEPARFDEGYESEWEWICLMHDEHIAPAERAKQTQPVPIRKIAGEKP